MRSLAWLAVSLFGSVAFAQPIFSEDWEGSTAQWRAIDANPIVVTSDGAPGCSTKFQHETIAVSGGRVFTNNAIAVIPNQAYCLTSWVRGSTGSRPFMGYGDSDVSGTLPGPNGDHWLMGDTFAVTTVTSDGVWRWYSASFSTSSSFILIMNEIFNGGGPGSADYDDIQLWLGACPTQPTGVDAHATCTTAAPVCSSSGACTACVNDSGCSSFPSTPACQPGGSCGQCSLTNQGQCTSTPTPACDTTQGLCVLCTASDPSVCASNPNGHACVPSPSPTPTCGCNADGDCGGATSGRICNTSTNGCIDGCSATGNGCPPGDFCTSSSSTPGACTNSCNFDSDCSGNTNGRTLCDSPNGCAQCTAVRLGACTTDGGPGPLCLGTGLCGCSSDDQCGAVMSGRICNSGSQLCQEGCRPDAGGCPGGDSCQPADGGNHLCTPVVATGDMAVPVDMAVRFDDGGVVKDMGRRDLAVALDGATQQDMSVPADLPLRIVLTGGGCTCDVTNRSTESPLAAVVIVGLAWALTRRRRRHRAER